MFCKYSILFLGEESNLGKGYIHLYICVHSGKLDLKKKKKKKRQKKTKLKKIGKHCIYISIFLISTNLFEKVVQSVTVVLKHYTNSLLVCPALSLEHLNQQGPSNLMPETK